MPKILKIQSVFRGHRARVMTSILKKAARIKKKYFLEEEFWETIQRGVVFKESQKLVKKEYEYKCTGAKYIGEWKGGFRNGKGTMIWKDGAKYEGEWVLGRANGQGVFTHLKGEVY